MQKSKVKILVLITILIAVGLAIFFFFVPAFAGEIPIESSISLGPINIRFYGIILSLAILTGYFVARKNSWRFGIDKNEVDNLTFWLVIVGLLGARIYYILFDFNYFALHPSQTYQIWHGGLSIFGSLIAGLLFLFLYTRKKAYSKYQVLDLTALALPLSQALGRFGNFFNQEAYGAPTDLPWKMFVASENKFVHPTFLYEAIGSVLFFFVLRKLVGRVPSGVLAGSFLAGYSLIRFFVESLRVDSVFINGFRADQIVAFLAVIFSFIMIWSRLRTTKSSSEI